jgi:hypothetical protein
MFSDEELQELKRTCRFKQIDKKAWLCSANGWTIGHRTSTEQYVVRDQRRAWIGIFNTLDEAQAAVSDGETGPTAQQRFRSIDD